MRLFYHTFQKSGFRVYLIILVITPAPTVWPPSRMANLKPSSIATGAISLTEILALSPGINYHGIKTEIASRNFRQNLLLVASKDDNYAFDSSERLFEISAAAKKEFIKHEDAGHGTRMLNSEPELKQRILDFLLKNF